MQKQNNTKSSLKLILFFDQVYDKENQNPLNQYDQEELRSNQNIRKRYQNKQEVNLNQHRALTNKIDSLQDICKFEITSKKQIAEYQIDKEIKSLDSKQFQQKEEQYLEELNQVKDDKKQLCSNQNIRKRHQNKQEVNLNQHRALTNKIDSFQDICKFEISSKKQIVEYQNDKEIKSLDSKQFQQKEEQFLEELNQVKEDKKQILNAKRPIIQLKEYVIEHEYQEKIRKIIKTDNHQIELMNQKNLYELEHSIENNLEYLNEKCIKLNEAIFQKKNQINALRKRKMSFQNQQETKDTQQIRYLNRFQIQNF
ncbi:hypothetical protein ABPG74_013856 [Tetrahymena malaccensis]